MVSRTLLVLCAVSLQQVHAAEPAGACTESAMLLAVKDLAPACIAECPGICPHLTQLITQALMAIDPTPYVCANSATFICMDTDACDQLLDYAASYNLFTVPRNEQELQDVCHLPASSTTTVSAETTASSQTQQAQHSTAGSGASTSPAGSTPASTSPLPYASQEAGEPEAIASPHENDSFVFNETAGGGYQDAIALDLAERRGPLRWVLAGLIGAWLWA
mmetsp:Transcript_53169/g.99701  ORF Transcript_53169/g.99701 Transcript_53169/m.99701 type:complete len:220 (+) Transcript_53169:74-733(+)